MSDCEDGLVRMQENKNVPEEDGNTTVEVAASASTGNEPNGGLPRRKRKPKLVKSTNENPEEPTTSTSQKNSPKLRVKSAPVPAEPATIAEIIAKRRNVLNYWRFLNARTAKKRVPVGPWKPEDIRRIFPDEKPPAGLIRTRFAVESEISDDAVIERVTVEEQPCRGSKDGEHDRNSQGPPASPGACGSSSCGISLKLKKIGSAWKPIAEDEGSQVCSSEEAAHGEGDVVAHKALKKKKHRHHDRPVETGTSHEERKLLKKRRKLLKQLKKSLKRQEALERAVEQSKERSKKADSTDEDSDESPEPTQTAGAMEVTAVTSVAAASSAPPKAVKKAVKPIAVVAGQPQAKRKPVDQLTSDTPRKKSATEESLKSTAEKPLPACEKPANIDVDPSEHDPASVRESLLKQLLEFESAKALSNANCSDASRGRPKRNVVADSLIKKLLDETSKNSTAVLEKKSQSILSKFLEGEDLMGQAFPMGDEDFLKAKATTSHDGSSSSVGVNIADLPPAPVSEVQYLRQVLNSQFYSIPSSLVVPRDQLFHFFAYPILCFCSLLAKQTALYGLVGREPDAILDGRVIVFATKQLPDILEHPKNYLPGILGSTLSSDSSSSSPSRSESTDAKSKEGESSSLLKSLLQHEPPGSSGNAGGVSVPENMDTSEPDESQHDEKKEAQCDSKTSSTHSGASKKPVPCLVKLPKESASSEGSSCDTTGNDTEMVSSTTKTPPVDADGEETSEDVPVLETTSVPPSVEETFGVIKVRGVEDVNKLSLDEFRSFGMEIQTAPRTAPGHLLMDLLRKEQRSPLVLSQTEAGYWRPKGVSATSKLPVGLRKSWTPPLASPQSLLGHTTSGAATPLMSPVGQQSSSNHMQGPPPARHLPVVSSSLSLSHENVKNWLNTWVKNHRVQQLSNVFEQRGMGQGSSGLTSPTTDRPLTLNMGHASFGAERPLNLGLRSPSITPDRSFNMGMTSPSSSSTSFVPHSPISPLGFMPDSRLNQLLSSPPLFSPPPSAHAVQHRMVTPPPPLHPPPPPEPSMFGYSSADFYACANNAYQHMLASQPFREETALQKGDAEKVGSSSSRPTVIAEEHPILSEALTAASARDGEHSQLVNGQSATMDTRTGCAVNGLSSSSATFRVGNERGVADQCEAGGGCQPSEVESVNNMARSDGSRDAAMNENGGMASDASMESFKAPPQETTSSLRGNDLALHDAARYFSNGSGNSSHGKQEKEPKEESALSGAVAKKEEQKACGSDMKTRMESHGGDNKRPMTSGTPAVKKLKGEDGCSMRDSYGHDGDSNGSATLNSIANISAKTVSEALSALDSPSSPPPERLPDVEDMGTLERMLVNVRKDIRDLDFQVKEKEREWNLLIHQKKKMEEYYLRLRRKREVGSLETNGTVVPPPAAPAATPSTSVERAMPKLVSKVETSIVPNKVVNTVSIISSGMSGGNVKTFSDQGPSPTPTRTISMVPDMVFGGNPRPKALGSSMMSQSQVVNTPKASASNSSNARLRNLLPMPNNVPTTAASSPLAGVSKATNQADLLQIYNEMLRQQHRQNSYHHAEKLHQALASGARSSNNFQRQTSQLQQALSMGSNASAAEAAAAAALAAATQQHAMSRSMDSAVPSTLEASWARHQGMDRSTSSAKPGNGHMAGTHVEKPKSREIGKTSEEPPPCHGCRQRIAQFVCAGCNSQWYCSRECQVSDWDEHAERCVAG